MERKADRMFGCAEAPSMLSDLSLARLMRSSGHFARGKTLACKPPMLDLTFGYGRNRTHPAVLYRTREAPGSYEPSFPRLLKKRPAGSKRRKCTSRTPYGSG